MGTGWWLRRRRRNRGGGVGESTRLYLQAQTLFAKKGVAAQPADSAQTWGKRLIVCFPELAAPVAVFVRNYERARFGGVTDRAAALQAAREAHHALRRTGAATPGS